MSNNSVHAEMTDSHALDSVDATISSISRSVNFILRVCKRMPSPSHRSAHEMFVMVEGGVLDKLPVVSEAPEDNRTVLEVC